MRYRLDEYGNMFPLSKIFPLTCLGEYEYDYSYDKQSPIPRSMSGRSATEVLTDSVGHMKIQDDDTETIPAENNTHIKTKDPYVTEEILDPRRYPYCLDSNHSIKLIHLRFQGSPRERFHIWQSKYTALTILKSIVI